MGEWDGWEDPGAGSWLWQPATWDDHAHKGKGKGKGKGKLNLPQSWLREGKNVQDWVVRASLEGVEIRN